jgi:hypothetical protein
MKISKSRLLYMLLTSLVQMEGGEVTLSVEEMADAVGGFRPCVHIDWDAGTFTVYLKEQYPRLFTPLHRRTRPRAARQSKKGHQRRE